MMYDGSHVCVNVAQLTVAALAQDAIGSSIAVRRHAASRKRATTSILRSPLQCRGVQRSASELNRTFSGAFVSGGRSIILPARYNTITV